MNTNTVHGRYPTSALNTRNHNDAITDSTIHAATGRTPVRIHANASQTTPSSIPAKAERIKLSHAESHHRFAECRHKRQRYDGTTQQQRRKGRRFIPVIQNKKQERLTEDIRGCLYQQENRQMLAEFADAQRRGILTHHMRHAANPTAQSKMRLMHRAVGVFAKAGLIGRQLPRAFPGNHHGAGEHQSRDYGHYHVSGRLGLAVYRQRPASGEWYESGGRSGNEHSGGRQLRPLAEILRHFARQRVVVRLKSLGQHHP